MAPASLNPVLIRWVNIVGWFWLAGCTVAIVVFSVVQAPRLLPTVWLFIPGGRSSQDGALPFATWVVILSLWLIVALFAAVMVLSQRISSPQRSGLIVLVILFSWLSSVVFASVVVSASAQIGRSGPLDKFGALALVSPVGRPAMFIVGLVALATAIGLPLLMLAVSQKPRNVR